MLLVHFTMILIAALILLTVGLVIYKGMIRKQIIHYNYTPFDYISGQTTVEFHEEKEEKAEEADPGDGLDPPSRR